MTTLNILPIGMVIPDEPDELYQYHDRVNRVMDVTDELNLTTAQLYQLQEQINGLIKTRRKGEIHDTFRVSEGQWLRLILHTMAVTTSKNRDDIEYEFNTTMVQTHEYLTATDQSSFKDKWVKTFLNKRLYVSDYETLGRLLDVIKTQERRKHFTLDLMTIYEVMNYSELKKCTTVSAVLTLFKKWREQAMETYTRDKAILERDNRIQELELMLAKTDKKLRNQYIKEQLSKGFTHREIAERLEVSTKTVQRIAKD